MLTALGKFLRKYRIDHGEILKSMAEKLQMTPAYLSSIENGKRTPPKYIIEKLSAIYLFTSEEMDCLQQSYIETVNEVTISLDHTNEFQRNLGVVFARKLDNLDQEQINSMLSILNKKENDSR